MEPLSLEVPLSDEKSGKRRRGRRRRRRGSGGRNGAPSNKSPAGDTQAVNRAINRFKQNPLPMGIPAEIDPPPKKIDVTWKTKAVSKNVQRKAGDIACIPGEFGFLPEDRVQEIAEKLDHLPISLEQALSLRSALNQEKSVYSHSRLMRRANELSRRYNSGESAVSYTHLRAHET